jgi:hypothetical protein
MEIYHCSVLGQSPEEFSAMNWDQQGTFEVVADCFVPQERQNHFHLTGLVIYDTIEPHRGFVRAFYGQKGNARDRHTFGSNARTSICRLYISYDIRLEALQYVGV